MARSLARPHLPNGPSHANFDGAMLLPLCVTITEFGATQLGLEYVDLTSCESFHSDIFVGAGLQQCPAGCGPVPKVSLSCLTLADCSSRANFTSMIRNTLTSYIGVLLAPRPSFFSPASNTIGRITVKTLGVLFPRQNIHQTLTGHLLAHRWDSLLVCASLHLVPRPWVSQQPSSITRQRAFLLHFMQSQSRATLGRQAHSF